jgi:hypothetical protein
MFKALVLISAASTVVACGPGVEGDEDLLVAEHEAALRRGNTTITWLYSRGVNATFFSLDESGCLLTDVSLFANADANRTTPGPVMRSELISVLVAQVDQCTGEPLLIGEGIADEITLQVAPGLHGARLIAPAVTLGDQVSGYFVDLSVDLHFSAIGPLQGGLTRDVNRDVPGFVTLSVLLQLWRDAEATGAVRVGSENLTPDPSFIAQIQNVSSGLVVVERGR